MARTDMQDVLDQPPQPSIGEAMYGLVERLYPICRSITGPGVRETLKIVSEWAPLDIVETPSGTQVFDWTVPKEWTIRDAYVADASGKRVIDFRAHNLHVLNYSAPIRARMSLAELRPHLFSLPEQPDAIPYRTSYYAENWGFCLRHSDLLAMEEGEYEVVVDSTLDDAGSLTYGELVLPGAIEDEILISTHTCHPSLANDNLSGIAVAAMLARRIAARTDRKHTFRFIFCPGTIGSITWLARNEGRAHLIKHGLVLTGLGDKGKLHYKQSRRGDTLVDRAAANVLARRGAPGQVIPFGPYGYDERQYCSPGFDLAVGRLTRSLHGEFPEYHTSGDNLSFMSASQLEDSLSAIEAIIDVLEGDGVHRNLNPKCEPRLGKRGLYRAVAGQAERQMNEMALLWVLSGSDGRTSLLEIAERAGMSFAAIRAAATALSATDLLAPAEPGHIA
jgi:aminopeptidase-like protein